MFSLNAPVNDKRSGVQETQPSTRILVIGAGYAGLLFTMRLAVNERNQIVVDPFLRSISHPEIFHNRGIRYTQPAEKTFGMSPLETSRSSLRLEASAAPMVVSVGPVKIVWEKYVEASSINLENV